MGFERWQPLLKSTRSIDPFHRLLVSGLRWAIAPVLSCHKAIPEPKSFVDFVNFHELWGDGVVESRIPRG